MRRGAARAAERTHRGGDHEQAVQLRVRHHHRPLHLAHAQAVRREEEVHGGAWRAGVRSAAQPAARPTLRAAPDGMEYAVPIPSYTSSPLTPALLLPAAGSSAAPANARFSLLRSVMPPDLVLAESWIMAIATERGSRPAARSRVSARSGRRQRARSPEASTCGGSSRVPSDLARRTRCRDAALFDLTWQGRKNMPTPVRDTPPPSTRKPCGRGARPGVGGHVRTRAHAGLRAHSPGPEASRSCRRSCRSQTAPARTRGPSARHTSRE